MLAVTHSALIRCYLVSQLQPEIRCKLSPPFFRRVMMSKSELVSGCDVCQYKR